MRFQQAVSIGSSSEFGDTDTRTEFLKNMHSYIWLERFHAVNLLHQKMCLSVPKRICDPFGEHLCLYIHSIPFLAVFLKVFLVLHFDFFLVHKQLSPFCNECSVDTHTDENSAAAKITVKTLQPFYWESPNMSFIPRQKFSFQKLLTRT